jgi:hypothetical protein
MISRRGIFSLILAAPGSACIPKALMPAEAPSVLSSIDQMVIETIDTIKPYDANAWLLTHAPLCSHPTIAPDARS